MFKRIHRVASILLTMIFIISTVAATFAFMDMEQHKTNGFKTTNYHYAVTLHKYEKVNGEVTETLVPNAEFYLYKVGDPDVQIGGRYITDENGRITINDIEPGDYYFLETNPSYGFTYDKDSTGGTVNRYDFNIGKKVEDVEVDVHAYNTRLQGGLIIAKTVVNENSSALTQEQLDIEFTFTVTFSNNGTYYYKIDGTGESILLTSGETLTLNHGHTAVFEDIPVGVQYTVMESKSEQYTSSSVNHEGNITESGIIVGFTNTYVENPGMLTVTKTVVNADGSELSEEQKNKEFTFTLVMDDTTETIILKHGESKTFTNLPIGMGYTITEGNYTTEGYVSSPQSTTGTITENGNTIPFVNVYEETPSMAPGRLEITKTVINPDGSALTAEQLDTQFTFTVTIGDVVQTIVLKHGESKLFENLPVGTTYTVEEIPTEGYTATTMKKTGVIVSNQQSQIAFINEKEDLKTTNLIVKKNVAGETGVGEIERVFNFILEVEGKEPIPFTLKANETKEFTDLPVGADYQVRETDTFSNGYLLTGTTNGAGTLTKESITAIFTNTFVGTVMIDITGGKTWDLQGQNPILPESITVNLKSGDILVDTIVVTPDIEGKWKYTFTAPKYDVNNNEIIYTVEELPITSWQSTTNGFNLINTYITPIIVAVPKVEKRITGDVPEEKINFNFVLTAKDNAPMPEGSNNGSKTLSIMGEGTEGFGQITYTKAGTYIYTIVESNTAENGYTYDTSEYTFTVIVEQQNDSLSVVSQTVTKDKKNSDKVVFTNIYEQGNNGEKIEIIGTKTWKHGENAPENYPDSILVYVKVQDVVIAQRTVSEEDHWTYIFHLPKYDAKGNEIIYTIDEQSIDGYVKTVNGYNLINTYDGSSDSNNGGNGGKASTGDDSNLDLWITLMCISFASIVTINKLRYKKRRV